MKGILVIAMISLGISYSMFAAEPAGKVKAKEKLDTVLGTDLPVMADNVIEIKKYDDKSRTYEVFAVQFPGEGSTMVTPEGLAKSIKTIDLDRIKKLPKSIVGQQFKTDQDLPGLKPEEIQLRAKK